MIQVAFRDRPEGSPPAVAPIAAATCLARFDGAAMPQKMASVISHRRYLGTASGRLNGIQTRFASGMASRRPDSPMASQYHTVQLYNSQHDPHCASRDASHQRQKPQGMASKSVPAILIDRRKIVVPHAGASGRSAETMVGSGRADPTRGNATI